MTFSSSWSIRIAEYHLMTLDLKSIKYPCLQFDDFLYYGILNAFCGIPLSSAYILSHPITFQKPCTVIKYPA